MNEKGWQNHEKASQELALVHPVCHVRPVPRWRNGRPDFGEVMEMEGFANLVSMLDYVLDTKRKRHITGGLLLSASLLFGSLAMTVMSIKDEEEVIVQEEFEDE